MDPWDQRIDVFAISPAIGIRLNVFFCNFVCFDFKQPIHLIMQFVIIVKTPTISEKWFLSKQQQKDCKFGTSRYQIGPSMYCLETALLGFRDRMRLINIIWSNENYSANQLVLFHVISESKCQFGRRYTFCSNRCDINLMIWNLLSPSHLWRFQTKKTSVCSKIHTFFWIDVIWRWSHKNCCPHHKLPLSKREEISLGKDAYFLWNRHDLNIIM